MVIISNVTKRQGGERESNSFRKKNGMNDRAARTGQSQTEELDWIIDSSCTASE